ncbi:methionyl-tRNA formyltransferase [Hymenobacter cheonanensis]|uniref:methionyl-tRNA formyltransferase n=1 Tax=Hymenobacter sp. CA2-7 TaxID=3063993 RepID=UPI0027141CE7|nr:formyltransferase family protein [Hymenobacter sp. CA2-7]MDO7886491.1 formyltransferase family protein [Hymenobacter sp. CA2-7]
MQVAVIISSTLGLPLLQVLAEQGAVAAVAVPHVPARPDQPEQVAQAAAALGLPVTRLHHASLAADLRTWLGENPPAAVLVFMLPWRVPAALLTVPRLGFLNFHLAALPGYRGPEPLFWQLRNGEPAGAVTVHRMTASFDTGPIVLAQPVPIGPGDTHGLHRTRLAHAAVAVGQQLLAGLRGEAPLPPEQPQDEAAAHYWPRATLADVCINWHEPAEAIARLVRATNPWNRGALATLRGQPLRVLAATARPETAAAPPGTVVWAEPGQGLLVACGASQLVQLDIVALDEGYFTGGQLAALGVPVGEVLTSAALPLAAAPA